MPGGYNTSGKPLQSIFGRQQQEYYVAKSRANDTAKDAIIAGLADGAAVVTRAGVVNAILEASLGGLETPGALNASVTGTVTRTGYKIDLVQFESLPNWTVTGNFYYPDGSESVAVPGVLVLCGHDTDGKVGYQSIAQGLCKSGYCALIIDAVGLHERKQIPSNSTVEEHREVGKNMPITGASMPALQARDAVAALDYLVSRTEVDDTHIGVTGTSGGGTQTMLVAALDDRITMIAPSCSATTHTGNIENELYADHEQILLDIQEAGLDWDDLCLRVLANGGAVCIIKQGGSATVSGDYFDPDGTDIIHARLVEYATLLGVDPADFARLFEDTNGHQLDDDGKREILRFFNTHTGVGSPSASWPSIVGEIEATLRVTATGAVIDLVGERNSVALITDLSDAAAIVRGTPTGSDLVEAVREVLRMPDYLDNGGDLTDETLRADPPRYRAWPFEDAWTNTGSGASPTVTPPNYPRPYGCRYGVETEPGIFSVLYFLTSSPWVSRLPTVSNGTTAFLYVSDLSADRELSTNEREALITTTFAANPSAAWFAVDLRGSGESQANLNVLYAALTTSGGSDDDLLARYAESFGAPLLGRRTWDLLRVIDLLASRGYTDIRLLSRRHGCNATTHAALLDSRVTAITLKNALTRWTAVAHASPGEIVWGMGDLPRRVLLYYDLPDIYADLAANKGLSSAFNSGHGQTEYGTSPWGAWGANAAGEF